MSQTNSAKRPLTTLQKSTKKKVTVRLKNEVEYKGKMDNVDSYMNLIMTDAEELHGWQNNCKLWKSHRKRQQCVVYQTRKRTLVSSGFYDQ